MPKGKVRIGGPRLVTQSNKGGRDELLREIERLRAELADAQETLRAIQSGEVDAVVVDGPAGQQVFTLEATETERQFHQLADSISNLAWMANPDGWIFWYNRRWYEYTGTTPAQMEGWGWQAVHDPKELPNVMRRWKGAIERGETFEMTFPLRGADGIFRPFLSHGTPVKDAEGNVVRWFGTNTDISAEKRTEEALRQTERLYRAIGESINYGVWVCDAEGRNIYSSESFLKLLGITQEQCSDFGWVDALHPDDAERTVEAWKECVRTQGHWDVEQRYLGVDGQWHPILTRGVPVRDERGKVTQWVGIHLDIGRSKRAEQALVRSEKLASLGRLAATIAHEINNPLEAVTNVLYLIGHESDIIRAHEYAKTGADELARVSHIVRQTLGFYRDSTAPQRVDVADLLDDVLSLYSKEFETRKISCEKQYERPGEVQAFAGEMRQVFSNLVRNALDAVPQGGVIRISTKRSRWDHKDGMSVFVCDNGPGIAPENRTKIFEPFFSTKGQKGTGLGLWVTKDLVQKHGGMLRVRSTANPPRRGSCFCVFIPS